MNSMKNDGADIPYIMLAKRQDPKNIRFEILCGLYWVGKPQVQQHPTR